MTSIRQLALTALLLAAGCADPAVTAEAPPEHPSPAAEALLLELYGQPFRFPREPATDLSISGFAILSNPASPGGRGPVVILEGRGGTRYLPVQRDADVADLYERVTGRPSGLPAGPLSSPYARATRR